MQRQVQTVQLTCDIMIDVSASAYAHLKCMYAYIQAFICQAYLWTFCIRDS